jgi:hypothetical protein
LSRLLHELDEFQFFIQTKIHKLCADYKSFSGKKIDAFPFVVGLPEVFDSLQNNRLRNFLHLVFCMQFSHIVLSLNVR